MRRFFAGLIIFCLLLSFRAQAGENLTTTPYHKLPRSWQKELDYYTGRALVPGILVMVSTPEWGNALGQSGATTFGGDTPIQPDMPFRVGPVTQLLTSIIILQLEAEHKLRLDMTIDEFFGGSSIPHSNTITLLDCLAMRAGIFSFNKEPALNGETPILGAEPLVPKAILSDLQRQMQDGALEVNLRYSPSLTGYLLAGKLIERIEKKPLAEVFKERIIKPLKLSSSYFEDGRKPPANMVHGYSGMNKVMRDRTAADSLLLGASGGFVSTGFDLMKTMKTIMKTRKLLSRLSYSKLCKFLDASSQRQEDSFALGMLERVSNRGIWRGVEGTVPGYYTLVAYYVFGDAMILIMINTSDNKDVGYELSNEILRRITGSTIAHLPANKGTVKLKNGNALLAWHAGFYYGKTYQIYVGESAAAVRRATTKSHQGVKYLTTGKKTFQVEVKNLTVGKTYYWRVDAMRHLSEDELADERMRRKTLREQSPELPFREVEEDEQIEGPVKSFVTR